MTYAQTIADLSAQASTAAAQTEAAMLTHRVYAALSLALVDQSMGMAFFALANAARRLLAEQPDEHREAMRGMVLDIVRDEH